MESEVLHVAEAEIAKLRVVPTNSPSQSEVHIPTIVENLTVEDLTAASSIDSETDVLSAESVDLEVNVVPKLKASTYDFIRYFQAAYAKARSDQSCPPVEESDFKLLEHYLEVHGTRLLEQWLPAFFASNFGYVRRRHWSLGSYLNTVFVLQARGKTDGMMADRRT